MDKNAEDSTDIFNISNTLKAHVVMPFLTHFVWLKHLLKHFPNILPYQSWKEHLRSFIQTYLFYR